MGGSSSLGAGPDVGGTKSAGWSLPEGHQGLLARALESTGTAVFVTGPQADGLPIVWVNEAFERETGYPLEEVAGTSPSALRDLLAEPLEADGLRADVEAGRPITHTVRSLRRDGSATWSQLSLTPVRDEDGEITHWVGVTADVSEHLDRYAAQVASFELERRERVGLDLIARSSDLLGDLDYPFALREICELLEGVLVGWAGFYLNDDGLRFAEGVDITSPPSGRGQRHGRHGVRTTGTSGPRADELGDEAPEPGGPGATGLVAEANDTVQDLLDGVVDGPVQLDLTESYPQWSASGWLSRDLEHRLGVLSGFPDVVQVHAIPGRRRVLGLLVTSPVVTGFGALLPDQETADAQAERDASTATVLQVIARRAGVAIDNVRLYAREHRLAETLQRAMLPEQADISGLDVWTYYAPNSEHAQVGGDWYDVLQITSDVVGLVIGDVVGHDVEAAAAMGQLRSVVRSYAYELTTPGPVLERVDQLVAGMRIPRSASLVYASLTRSGAFADAPTVPGTGAGEPRGALADVLAGDPGEPTVDSVDTVDAGDGDTDGEGGADGTSRPAPATEIEVPDAWTIEYSRAGHLPPLLLRDEAVTQLNEAGGSLVGFGSGTRGTGRVELLPGDVLLFYTDGLIERRDRALRVGLDALIEASSAITAIDAAGIGEELLSRLADAPEDDVALVVVRVPDPVADPHVTALSPRSRRWLLPSEPASIGRARHAVVRTCQAWDLGDSGNAELVVSELVANGVLHGWGHIALRLFDTGDGLRIEVEDSNPAPPVTTDGHPNRIGGFGMQIVERLADWGWRPAGSGKLVWAKLRPTRRHPDEGLPTESDAAPTDRDEQAE